MKTSIEHWAVVKLSHLYAPALVILDIPEHRTGNSCVGTVYWNGGPSYMPDAKYEILEEITVDGNSAKGMEAIDQLELNMYKKYTKMEPAKEPTVSEGWIAPNGDVYFCRYGQHISTAKVLAAKFYDSLEGEKVLEEKKWLKLYADGLIIRGDYEFKCTQAQMDTLAWLITVPDGGWKSELKQHLRHYEVEETIS